MKRGRLALFTIACAFLSAYNAFAGNDSLKLRPLNPQSVRHIIKTNPLPLFWGSIPYTSEFRFIQEVPVALFQSSQIGFSYIGKSLFLNMAENAVRQNNEPRIKVSGFRIQYSHRFFFARNSYAPEGAYIGPHVSYTTAQFSTRYSKQFDYYIQATHFNANMLMGYQAISRDGFAVDAFFGIGYKKNSWEYHQSHTSVPIDLNDIPFYGSNVKYTLGFNFGLVF